MSAENPSSCITTPERGLAQAGIVARAQSLLRNRAIRGMAGVFALKASIVLSSFALLTLAARALGEVDFGTYSVLFSAAGLFCIVATFGQQVLIMRNWNEQVAAGDAARLKGALRFSVVTCVTGCLLVGFLFAPVVATMFPFREAMAATLYLVMLAAVLTSSHLVRTAVGVGAGDGYGNLLIVLPAIAYLALCLANGIHGDIAIVFLLFAAGGALCLAIHVVMIRQKLAATFPGIKAIRPTGDIRLWSTRSLKLWVSNALDASNQYVDVLIIGYLMSPAVAGAYFVTTRLANAFATASDAMHMFSTRHIPDLYYRRDFKTLDELLNSVARITLLVVASGMVVMLGAGPWLLAAFNTAYMSYYPALALLCVGTAAVAAIGPCGSILMLTGHEGRHLGIMALSVVMRAIGFFVLIPRFGITGAVAATTLSFLFMAIALRHATKSLTGIDGSVTRLIGLNAPQRTFPVGP